MRRSFLCAATAAALLAAATAQQRPEHMATGVLLVRFAPGDLVLNKPLLDALVNEPAAVERVTQNVGTGFETRGFRVELPAPHLAGVFQIHLYLSFVAPGEQTQERRQAVLDGVVTHLQERLNELLFAQPAHEIEARREEIVRRLTDLRARREEIASQTAIATASAAELQRLRETLSQQMLTTRLDLATEECAKTQLDALIAESMKRREELQEEFSRQQRDVVDLEKKVADLSQRAQTSTAEGQVAAELRQLMARRDSESVAGARLQETARDHQRALAALLEQVPATTLTLQRARARLQSLHDEEVRLDERLQKAAERSSPRLQSEIEQLDVELTVQRALLAEIQGKLARLAPVRYELLRSR